MHKQTKKQTNNICPSGFAYNMKLISYYNQTDQLEQAAILVGSMAYDLNLLDKELPPTMAEFLFGEDETMVLAKAYDAQIKAGNKVRATPKPIQSLALLAPVPHPPSLRDAYAFRQHVAAGRRNRGLDMIPEFDEFPVFYFSNHHAINGPGDIAVMPDHLHQLDFELEIAAVIGWAGYNIRAEEADDFIAGFIVMNDFSARLLQMIEMKLNLGPAKGKDFATALGPYLVTPDELQAFVCPTPKGHIGKQYNLKMQCKVNGALVSQGSTADMNWTFAEIIERINYGTEMYPGEIIGSGTVGTGCFLELNGTAKHQNPNAFENWLKLGDEVELSIEGLGVLYNRIIKSEDDFSILAQQKKFRK